YLPPDVLCTLLGQGSLLRRAAHRVQQGDDPPDHRGRGPGRAVDAPGAAGGRGVDRLCGVRAGHHAELDPGRAVTRYRDPPGTTPDDGAVRGDDPGAVRHRGVAR